MIAFLQSLDPWMLLTVMFALLWVVEMRASQRRWMNGMVHGYSIAARQANERDSYTAEAVRGGAAL